MYFFDFFYHFIFFPSILKYFFVISIYVLLVFRIFISSITYFHCFIAMLSCVCISVGWGSRESLYIIILIIAINTYSQHFHHRPSISSPSSSLRSPSINRHHQNNSTSLQWLGNNFPFPHKAVPFWNLIYLLKLCFVKLPSHFKHACRCGL